MQNAFVAAAKLARDVFVAALSNVVAWWLIAAFGLVAYAATKL